MNRLDIIKSLAPGFLPLIVYIVADSLWGVKVGLVVAVGFGIVELGFSYFKERILDKFIAVDIGLIVVLGIISIVLENDIFFKLKPALIELIFCILLAVSVFSPMNIMLLLSKRYMKDIRLNEMQVKQINRNLKALLWIFSFHTVLIVYSAFFMSKQAWAFISGGLFYIIFAGYLVFEIARTRIRNRRWIDKYRDEEWLDIVDSEGRITGKAPRSVCHSGPGNLHPVVHLHIMNQHDRIYLQKRSKNKEIQPGKWDTAVGGHVLSGETIEQSMKREAFEELGLETFKPQLVAKYKWESDVESELVFMFVAQVNSAIRVNTQEIEAGKFWRIKKIRENIGKGIFTPNFEFEFNLLLQQVFKQPGLS